MATLESAIGGEEPIGRTKAEIALLPKNELECCHYGSEEYSIFTLDFLGRPVQLPRDDITIITVIADANTRLPC